LPEPGLTGPVRAVHSGECVWKPFSIPPSRNHRPTNKLRLRAVPGFSASLNLSQPGKPTIRPPRPFGRAVPLAARPRTRCTRRLGHPPAQGRSA